MFPYGVRFAEILPASILIYSTVVGRSCVGGQNLRLLKSVSAKFSGSPLDTISSHLNIVSFQNLDYHPLKASQLSTLDFEIHDHAGKLVKFAPDMLPVLLNLMISKDLN